MMANLSEDIHCAGSDTRLPMLDRTDFESWQQRIRLYCLGKDNWVNILKSINEGSFNMGRFRETLAEGALHLGLERDKVFADLHQKKMRGLKLTFMLLERSKLTKDERELQLYDDFKHFRQNKRETIHEYYVRFTKLINDMRNIKMTMPKMQLNSKFVNTMLSDWGRFVTAVKLNRGMKTSNYDQLYAYVKQHEAHANENRMMLERYNQHAIDPLALVSNVSPHQYPSQSSVIPQSAYGRQNRGQGNYARGAITSGNRGVQNRVGNANPGQARQIKCYNCNRIGHIARNCTQPKRLHNSEYFKDKMLLMQARENGAVLDEEQLLFIAGGQTNTFDDDVDEAPVQDLALNEDNIFQADQCDAFDSDVNEAPTTQTMLMANLSLADPIYDEAVPSYDSDILSENKVVNESLSSKLARYKEQVELYENRARFLLTEREQKIYEQMRIIIQDRNVQEELLKKELHSVKMQLNSTINHNKLIKEEVTTLKKDFKQKENKYLEEFLDMKQLKEKVEDKLYNKKHSLQTVFKTNYTLAIVHESEDTLEIVEKTRIGMLEKMKNTLKVDSNIKIAPPDYSKENYLATFTP
ncbi:retrovirus-related pol polyprotein from transposon TNT 1-94 [Tanacetum coccineum]